jgi:hypothetical protein
MKIADVFFVLSRQHAPSVSTSAGRAGGCGGLSLGRCVMRISGNLGLLQEQGCDIMQADSI